MGKGLLQKEMGLQGTKAINYILTGDFKNQKGRGRGGNCACLFKSLFSLATLSGSTAVPVSPDKRKVENLLWRK